VGEWLDAGVLIAWVIDPHRKVAHVYRADGSVSAVAADGNLDGEGLLPGLSFPLAEVFE
jgi:Uma2 family endonuclease